jgi:hypothetical protein
MVEDIPRMRTLPPIDSQHWQEELAQSLRVCLTVEVLLDHNSFQRPWFQCTDVP